MECLLCLLARCGSSVQSSTCVSVHARFIFMLCSVCVSVCVHAGLAAANLGVTCGTPELACGSGGGLGGHVITQLFT